ncbi:hypothetical protein JX265_009202 [Neoarthrinium moseri]|uniref:Uncharacterized protein n=1 Tax=Neoarthrinium moseri TaxID=1658444 RepID=A0A9Q0ALI0_9PEZI|nr:uncharacterized protein JN550_006632 [Neoarthrinium moseri]KAI1847774.1 hypothetical protein JX266_006269 [Neoarthrinium moseri]KAI1862488.1 hypothetical protein JX265_009202 [Neoarthrinium moseri]KAI1868144.1 hypothetical protein JN550_006632 [Neoarthrinium moseri]
MATATTTPPQRPPPSSAELKEIAAKSLQTGALTGAMGSVVGLGSGIMRSAPPALFAVFSGLQWFALGSSFIASRSLLHHAWGGEENLVPMDKVSASAVAGGVSGMIGGLVRGPRNILPGIFFFSALGGGATFLSQKLQSREPKEKKTSLLASKWSPLKPLSDKDYEQLLEEKILRLDAEIAIIDDSIAALKAEQQGKPKVK